MMSNYEGRLAALEMKVEESSRAIHYLANKIVLVEEVLVRRGIEDEEVHKKLTGLSTDLRLLLPKLEASVEYVNKFKAAESSRPSPVNVPNGEAAKPKTANKIAQPYKPQELPKSEEYSPISFQQFCTTMKDKYPPEKIPRENLGLFKYVPGTGSAVVTAASPKPASQLSYAEISKSGQGAGAVSVGKQNGIAVREQGSILPNVKSQVTKVAPAPTSTGFSPWVDGSEHHTDRTGHLVTSVLKEVRAVKAAMNGHAQLGAVAAAGENFLASVPSTRVKPLYSNISSGSMAFGTSEGTSYPMQYNGVSGSSTNFPTTAPLTNGSKPANTKPLAVVGQKETSASLPGTKFDVTVGSKSPKLCNKFCGALRHQCNHAEHPNSRCPPCVVKMETKLSCGHASEVHCFEAEGQTKCRQCELVSSDVQEGVDFGELEHEIGEDIRSAINKFSLQDLNACKIELVEMIKQHEKRATFISSVLFQKTLSEYHTNDSSPKYLAELVSKVVNYLGPRGHQFKNDFKSVVLEAFEARMGISWGTNTNIQDAGLMLKVLSSKMPNATVDEQKNILFEIIRQLYAWNIFSISDLRERVLDPLLGQPDAVLLTVKFLIHEVGKCIAEDISGLGDDNVYTDFKTWFANYIQYMSDFSSQCSEPEKSVLQVFINELLDLKATTWNVARSPNSKANRIRKSSTLLSSPSDFNESGSTVTQYYSLCSDDTFYTPNSGLHKTKSSKNSSSSSVSSSSGQKPSVAVQETEAFFANYMKIHKGKKNPRIQWLRSSLFEKDECYMGAFLRTMSHIVPALTDKNQLEQMGHMLGLLIEAEIVSHERIVKSFHEGVFWTLLDKEASNAELELKMDKLSKVLVNAFVPHGQPLSWLLSVGASLEKNFPHRWHTFCSICLRLIRKRYKDLASQLVKSLPKGEKEKIKPIYDTI